MTCLIRPYWPGNDLVVLTSWRRHCFASVAYFRGRVSLPPPLVPTKVVHETGNWRATDSWSKCTKSHILNFKYFGFPISGGSDLSPHQREGRERDGIEKSERRGNVGEGRKWKNKLCLFNIISKKLCKVSFIVRYAKLIDNNSNYM